MEGEIFWLDKFEGIVQDGYFVRSDLHKMITQFRANGLKIVGIKLKEDDFNTELICTKIDKSEENKQ